MSQRLGQNAVNIAVIIASIVNYSEMDPSLSANAGCL